MKRFPIIIASCMALTWPQATQANERPNIFNGCGKLLTEFVDAAWSLPQATSFSARFIRDLRGRTRAVSRDANEVMDQLAAQNQLPPYVAPKGNHSLVIRGTLEFSANVSEYFTLWATFLNMGRGAPHDRLFVDMVDRFATEAPNVAALRHIPLLTRDQFYAVVENGRMVSFVENIANYGFKIFPASSTAFVYKRDAATQPRTANPFEAIIDRYNGDMTKVEQDYASTYRPELYLPGSKATIKVKMEQIEQLPASIKRQIDRAPSGYSQRLLLPGGIPMP